MDLGEIKPRNTLDETVEKLISLHDMGIKATCNFNGHIFDSETVTMDSAYQAVMGCTKAEFDKKAEEMKKRDEKETQEALEKVPQWIERGNKLIYPERQEEWATCVSKRAKGLYKGLEVEDTIEIMEALENVPDMRKAKEIIEEQGHSGASFGLVTRMVFAFSKKGPEFYEMMIPREVRDEETQKIIDQKKIENKILMEKYNRLEKTK